MATMEASQQIYILGNKQDVEQCMSNLTGTTPQLGNDVWTVSENTPIRHGDPSMENFKEYDMDCDDDASVNSDRGKRLHMASTETSVKMKRLKSLGSSTESNSTLSYADVGYESDSNDPDGKELIADINVVVLDDDSGLHKKVASFIIKLIILPALIILAADSESFNKEIYVNFIKELSVLASMKEDETSKLLMVGINHKRTAKINEGANKLMEQIRDEFQWDISDTYFGAHFNWCEIENMTSKVKEVTHKMGWRLCTRTFEIKSLSKLYKGKCFIETKTVKETHLEFVNQNFTFKSHNIEYVCRPNYIINEFVRALKKISDIRCALKKLELFKSNDNFSDRSKFIDAFTKVGLIHTEIKGTDETVFVMPFVCSKSMPVFDEIESSVKTSVLKLTVELVIIPVFVMVNIIKLFTTVHKWILKSSGPAECGSTDSYYFVKESRGLLMQCGFSTKTTSYICLCGFGNRSHSDYNSNREYETLRQGVERELRSWKSYYTSAKSFICNHIKHNDSSDGTDILKTTAENWNEVDFEKMETLSDVRSLLPWFLSKVNEIEVEMSKKMSDAFLADVASLFGFGYKLFFTVEGIPAERLSQIEIDHSKSVKDAIMKMLLEWRKIKGPEANMDALRSAIKNSPHVTVNMKDFDELVQKHHGET